MSVPRYDHVKEGRGGRDLRRDVEASSPITGLDRNLDSKLIALSLFW